MSRGFPRWIRKDPTAAAENLLRSLSMPKTSLVKKGALPDTRHNATLVDNVVAGVSRVSGTGGEHYARR